MNVSQYIAKFLKSKGIDTIFFIDGSAAASLIVAVDEAGLKYCCPLHEQAGSFMVDAVYKSSSKIGCMIATSGPGGQNLLNGIAASWYDSVPAFYITGNVNSKFLKKSETIRQHGFQENDIVAMAKPITKYVTMVTDPQQIAYELEKAYYIATNGRPGPVLLDIPMDVQKAEILEEMLPRYFPKEEPKESTLDREIDQLIEMLKVAERPVALIGGGVRISGADKQVMELLEKLQIPFFETWNMLDFCDDNHPLFGGRVGTFGGDGRNFGIQNCDLLLAIGSRISGRITGGMVDTFARAAKKVIVDIDPEELKWQCVKGDLNICSDAKRFALEFLKRNTETNNWTWWISKIKDWKRKYSVVIPEYYKENDIVNPYVFIKELCKLLPSDAVIVHEAGGNCVITSQTFKAKLGQRVFTNNGNSSLGYALPAAVGASIATGKQVICITGDGGLNFNIQEFQTLKTYNLPIKVFIFNNNIYGITKAYRDTNFNSNYAGVDKNHGVQMPDFPNVALAYGLATTRISNHNNLDMVLKDVLNFNGPIICDVNMSGFYNYNPKLGWRNPIEDQYPFLPRDEFKSNLLIEPIGDWENPIYP